MIEMHNITKAYGTRGKRHTVLSNVSVLFDGSDDVGILGHNGSGKSTLLRLLAGMERPDAGQVVRRARVSYPVGFAGAFHPNLSAHDNVRFLARMYRADAAGMARFVREFSEIGPYFDRPLSTYSNSMRARVTFAASIALEFDIYLVDEVTAVGDVAFKRKCLEAFSTRRRNAKVIMASQAVTTIGRICQRGMILDGGVLRLFGTMKDAMAAYEKHLLVKDVAHDA